MPGLLRKKPNKSSPISVITNVMKSDSAYKEVILASDEFEMIAQAQAGGRDAFSELVRHHYDPVTTPIRTKWSCDNLNIIILQ